jgi:hypothetical protein
MSALQPLGVALLAWAIVFVPIWWALHVVDKRYRKRHGMAA